MALALPALAALVGCDTPSPTAQTSTATETSTPAAGSQTRVLSVAASPSRPGSRVSGRPADVVVAATVATGLDVPWGVAVDQAARGHTAAFVAERGSAAVLRVVEGAPPRRVGVVAGVRASGEGGLLGLAVVQRGEGVPASPAKRLYAYFTSDDGDNRIVRMDLTGPASAPTLGRPVLVLSGIPAAENHNGGRIVLGPDGHLWIGTGDAQQTDNAQDRQSLGGKILRIDLDGRSPADNPFQTPVWSYGHRNVQGLAFDSAGRLWAGEFGQNTWDELNLVVKGGNYGWPLAEGDETPVAAEPTERLIAPKAIWHTDEASPSGLAIVDDVAYLAGLRGQRLWQIPLREDDAGTPRALFTGDYGRLRTVVAVPGGLWLTTSNTDGRGAPRRGDDRILRLALTENE